MDYEKISFRPGVKCWHCKELVEDDERRPVFYEKDAAHKVCEFCVSEMENSGEAIRCEGCGDLFLSEMLKAEEIYGETFTPCPHCDVDVVTGWSREKYIEQYKPFMDCETTSCAYNNGGECRFSAVFDREPKITEEDGCTEGVIKDGVINV